MTEVAICLKSKSRKARKQHECCECFSVIKRGQQYNYTSGICSEGPVSYKQCLPCHRLFESLTEDNYINGYEDEGPWFGGIFEYLMNFGLARNHWPELDKENSKHALPIVRRTLNEWRAKRHLRFLQVCSQSMTERYIGG